MPLIPMPSTAHDSEPPAEPAPPTDRNVGGYELAALEPARAQFRDLALSVEGLGAAAATRSAYLDLIAIAPEDRASTAMCNAFAAMSSCGLVVRGLWFRAGVMHPILLAPYVVGRAVSDVVEIARTAGALHGPERMPGIGDIVIVGGPEHVLTVIDVDGTTIRSVDGGQRDEHGLECIRRRERVYVVGLHGASLGGRPVLHVIDAVAIAACERWLPDAALGVG